MTAMIPGPYPTSWEVTGVSEVTDFSDTGQLVHGYSVMFRTGAGNNAKVFVPQAVFTPDTVARMVQARAEVLDSVRGLTSGS